MFSGSCRTCGHKISCHRAATYNSRAYLDEKRNERVDANILTESEARIRIDYLIRDLKERSKLLEKEKETVQESMAKFAHFLKRNAITPYNDTYQEYIKCLIDK